MFPSKRIIAAFDESAEEEEKLDLPTSLFQQSHSRVIGYGSGKGEGRIFVRNENYHLQEVSQKGSAYNCPDSSNATFFNSLETKSFCCKVG
jgi:hypothetical protein